MKTFAGVLSCFAVAALVTWIVPSIPFVVFVTLIWAWLAGKWLGIGTGPRTLRENQERLEYPQRAVAVNEFDTGAMPSARLAAKAEQDLRSSPGEFIS